MRDNHVLCKHLLTTRDQEESEGLSVNYWRNADDVGMIAYNMIII